MNSIKLNNFEVEIENARLFQKDGAYFAAIPNGANFAIKIKSHWGYNKSPFEFDLTMNGNKIGSFQSHDSYRIETKPDSGQKFVAYVQHSYEAYQAGQTASYDEKIGLIKIEAYPSKEKETYRGNTLDLLDGNKMMSRGFYKSKSEVQPMQIGLQGKSDQKFQTVQGIERDYNNKTTFYIRLVKEEIDYDQINSLSQPKSTRYPKI